jgi:hypothetical protein
MCGEKKATPPAALLQSMGKTPRLLLENAAWDANSMHAEWKSNSTSLDRENRWRKSLMEFMANGGKKLSISIFFHQTE